MRRQLVVKLPPSVNDRYMILYNTRRLILSNKYRDALEDISFTLKMYWANRPQIEDYFFLDLYWYLPNHRRDAHNMEKPLFDAMQNAGIVKNDKLIMNRTQLVEFDKLNPHVRMEFDDGTI